MKIILSRKGFDSTQENGGVASPIFEDQSMLSLPIPETEKSKTTSCLTYDNLRFSDISGALCVNIDVASNKEVNYGIFKSSDGRRVKKSLAA